MYINNFVVEYCILTSRISDYPLISQGKTRIPGVNDGDDFELTDVSVLALWKTEKPNRSTRFLIKNFPVYIRVNFDSNFFFLDARTQKKTRS